MIGSYHGFRYGIIEALPDFSFADPRTHRQASTAKLVCDDLGEAEEYQVPLNEIDVWEYTELQRIKEEAHEKRAALGPAPSIDTMLTRRFFQNGQNQGG